MHILGLEHSGTSALIDLLRVNGIDAARRDRMNEPLVAGGVVGGLIIFKHPADWMASILSRAPGSDPVHCASRWNCMAHYAQRNKVEAVRWDQIKTERGQREYLSERWGADNPETVSAYYRNHRPQAVEFSPREPLNIDDPRLANFSARKVAWLGWNCVARDVHSIRIRPNEIAEAAADDESIDAEGLARIDAVLSEVKQSGDRRCRGCYRISREALAEACDRHGVDIHSIEKLNRGAP